MFFYMFVFFFVFSFFHLCLTSDAPSTVVFTFRASHARRPCFVFALSDFFLSARCNQLTHTHLAHQPRAFADVPSPHFLLFPLSGLCVPVAAAPVMVPPRHRCYEHTGGRGHGLVVGRDAGRKPDLAGRAEISETGLPPPL